MPEVDYLIVGLGNPGKKYENTRHNIGFMVTKELLYSLDGKSWKNKGNAKISDVFFLGKKLIIANPYTFMNNSGEAVSHLTRYFKIEPERIFVICDDLDLPFGKIRIRAKGGSAGHKGMVSIISHINSENFPRMRIGIDKPIKEEETESYVLSNFNKEEKEISKEVIKKAVDAIKCFLKEGLEICMNKYNG